MKKLGLLIATVGCLSFAYAQQEAPLASTDTATTAELAQRGEIKGQLKTPLRPEIEKQIEDADTPCRQDRQLFCKGVAKAEVIGCLQDHRNQISMACSDVLPGGAMTSPSASLGLPGLHR